MISMIEKKSDRLNFNSAAPRSERFILRTRWEIEPNPENRVILIQKKDRLSQNQVRLHFQISDNDRKTPIDFLWLLGSEMGRNKLGRLMYNFDEKSEQWPIYFIHHHMGTTRMSDNPQFGVVDKDCKLHQISNAYIAGSSVFPTAGYVNPTLTIVALAIKLADHLKAKIL